jgi:hypothetical protein
MHQWAGRLISVSTNSLETDDNLCQCQVAILLLECPYINTLIFLQNGIQQEVNDVCQATIPKKKQL